MKMPVINYMYLMLSLIRNSGHGFKYFIKEASAADMLIIYRLCSTYPVPRHSDNFVACLKVWGKKRSSWCVLSNVSIYFFLLTLFHMLVK